MVAADRRVRTRSRHLSASLKAVGSKPMPCFHRGSYVRWGTLGQRDGCRHLPAHAPRQSQPPDLPPRVPTLTPRQGRTPLWVIAANLVLLLVAPIGGVTLLNALGVLLGN